MKNYKLYKTKSIGSSDYATLLLVGCDNNGVVSKTLTFGGDNIYEAYIVDENAIIGKHYKLMATFNHWLKIYDDFELTAQYSAQTINIYKSGQYGCIIQLIKQKINNSL